MTNFPSASLFAVAMVCMPCEPGCTSVTATAAWGLPVVALTTVPSTEASSQEPVASSQNRILMTWPFRIRRRISLAWGISRGSGDKHLPAALSLGLAALAPCRTFRFQPAHLPIPPAIRAWSVDNLRPTIFPRDTRTASRAGFRRSEPYGLPGAVSATPDRPVEDPWTEWSV